jgi:pSer/pThr/pTyr-binding forkhead associated (FHA) protein
MRSRIILGVILGAVGGFIGFVIQEITVNHSLLLAPSEAVRQMTFFGIIIGICIGLSLGLVEGLVTGRSELLLRGALMGAVLGGVSGAIGVYLAGEIYDAILMGQNPGMLQGLGLLGFILDVFARTIGWMFFGGFIGAAVGASLLSWKRVRNGLIGGLVGGALGGMIFDLAAELIAQPLMTMQGAGGVHEVGGPSRAIGITSIGLFTGLFIGLAEEWFKEAWVVVTSGRKEGRKIILANSMSYIGRDERADVPVFADPTLTPQHVAIQEENGRRFLVFGGHPPVPVVNGVPVQGRQLLKDGDVLQIGTVNIIFHEKATSQRVRKPAVDVPRSGPSISNVPPNYCPFCGAMKDAAGNCLCSVPSAGAHAPQPNVGPPLMGGGLPNTTVNMSSGGGAAGFQSTGNTLTGISGPSMGMSFILSGDNITIGRELNNVIALASDSAVSRRHAHIVMEGGVHVLYDDNSSNGTFVNGARITQQALSKGDLVQFGASQFRYD